MLNLMLSLISGLLTGLSFDLSWLSFLPWFSLVPFFYAIAKSRRPKEDVLNGLAFGAAYYSVSIFWINNVTSLGFILLVFYLSVYCVLFSLAGRYFLNKPFSLVALPCFWVILEFLKENIWSGFGWANLAYSQYQNFFLIQPVDLLGAKFISFFIVMVNVLLWEVIFSRKPDKAVVKKAVLVVFIFAACFFYSSFKLGAPFQKSSECASCAEIEAESSKSFTRLSVVQPNVPQELKWEPGFSPLIVSRLKRLSAQTHKDSLVVFPEASWPYIVDEDNLSELKSFIKNINRKTLIGAITQREGLFYNSALLFEKNSRLNDTYHKIKLVPFGEYVPLRRFLGFIDALSVLGDMSHGKEFTRFFYRKRGFSVLICFEDVSPLHTAKFARDSNFVLNITNDAWFKGEPEASQHFGIMVLRAVENRVPIIRCANTGISGWVSSKGEIEKLRRDNKELFVEAVENYKVPISRERSFYNKYPELFVLMCLIFLFAHAAAGRIKRRWL